MPANSSRSLRAAKTQRPASSLGSRRRFDTARRSVSALGAAALMLLGARGGNAVTNTNSYTGGGTGTIAAPINGNFTTGFSPTLTAGGSATTILGFGGTTAYTATDDETTQTILNALNFTNSAAITLARGTGGANNSLSFQGTTPTIYLSNNGLVTNNLDMAITGTTGNTSINQSGTGAAIFTGVISGATNNGVGTTITLSGAGANNATQALTLTGTNTYAGNWLVNSSGGANNNYSNVDLILNSATGPAIAGNLQVGNGGTVTAVVAWPPTS